MVLEVKTVSACNELLGILFLFVSGARWEHLQVTGSRLKNNLGLQYYLDTIRMIFRKSLLGEEKKIFERTLGNGHL